jgi:hypothetical protein
MREVKAQIPDCYFITLFESKEKKECCKKYKKAKRCKKCPKKH